MIYNAKTDEDLTNLAKQGDAKAQEALLARFKNLVRKIARPYFIAGASSEDLAQEGMIGLYKAISDFCPRGGPFAPFAAACIKNQILSAIKQASRKKHSPLNTYVPIDSTLKITDEHHNPEKILIDKESIAGIERFVTGRLSPLEKAVLLHYLDGLTYAEIAEKTGCSTKSVDNALTRIRRKAEVKKNP